MNVAKCPCSPHFICQPVKRAHRGSMKWPVVPRTAELAAERMLFCYGSNLSKDIIREFTSKSSILRILSSCLVISAYCLSNS